MNKDEFMTYLLVGAILIGVIIGALFIDSICDEKTWNNGYHSCGGKWEYQQPVGHAYNTYFLYECDKCHKTHEFYKKR